MALDKRTKQNLRLLRLQVEQAAHRKMRTPSDFSILSDRMKERIGETLSVSTLKRIWGYVGAYECPRLATLNILCRYLGYADWEEFIINYCDNPYAEDSEVLLKDCLFAHELQTNELLTISWNPNRHSQLRYLGNCLFEVEDAEHSILQPGDQFRCAFFIIRQPLYLGLLTSRDNKIKSKVCVIAPKGGITGITRDQDKE